MPKKFGLLFFIFSLLFVLKTDSANAATLTSLSDTITTSRPSAASPLSADEASGQVDISIVNNGSRYFASDSAKIMRTSTTADIVTGITVASQSSDLTTVYLTSGTGAAAQQGTDVLIANISAMHTIQFITATPIPSGGKIVLTFPGSGSTAASPSATTFSFNGLTTANASTNIKTNNASTCTFSVTAPSITCTTNAVINAGTTVTFLIGCTANTGASCTTQAPRLINPTKTAAAGTADSWNVNVTTQDSGSVNLDMGSTKIGTVESVQVRASVDSSFSFTIAGIANGAAANTGNTTGCTNTELTNSGFAATATLINLGSLPVSSAVEPNISAQLISITSNGVNGYTLTATSSGQLRDDSTGFDIASATTPAAFPATTPWFGIHACGADVNTSTWGAASSTTTRGGSALYGWPTQVTSVSLASDATGPIAGASGNGLTTVEYAAAADANVPSGTYASEITYVATPVF